MHKCSIAAYSATLWFVFAHISLSLLFLSHQRIFSAFVCRIFCLLEMSWRCQHMGGSLSSCFSLLLLLLLLTDIAPEGIFSPETTRLGHMTCRLSCISTGVSPPTVFSWIPHSQTCFTSVVRARLHSILYKRHAHICTLTGCISFSVWRCHHSHTHTQDTSPRVSTVLVWWCCGARMSPLYKWSSVYLIRRLSTGRWCGHPAHVM